MLSKNDVEFYAEQLTKPEFEENGDLLLDHLDDDDLVTVMARVAAIAREKAATAKAEADDAVALLDVVRRTGCPDWRPRNRMAQRTRLERNRRC